MNTLTFILYLLAFICFVIATFRPYPWPGSNPNTGFAINFIALGLALWVLVALIGSLKLVTG